MDSNILNTMPKLLDILGLDEEPFGLCYTEERPVEGFSPKPADLPTRAKEKRDEIDWQEVIGNFSCVMGHLWRARKKRTVAYFSKEQFGCPGGAFWLGFNKPQAETIINHVTTGNPGLTEGELLWESPDVCRRIYAQVDPRPAPAKFCVIKPIRKFESCPAPELVLFFCRPESLCGLHNLAAFVTSDPEVVASPCTAACGSLAVWPLHYLARGENKAVIGGLDPSARKFLKTDELSFTVPYPMFTEMLQRQSESFLTTKSWTTVRKKIARSKKAWGETTA
jgi:uncharacterized protein (DUF169 family)